MTISEALDATLANGGGTFWVGSLEPVTHGPWAVGGRLPGRVIDLALPGKSRAFRFACAGLTRDGALVIGTWVDEGMLYIDAVDLVDDTDEAIALAAERGERAIYHLTDGITLEVSK